jgi:hypothetical protein
VSSFDYFNISFIKEEGGKRLIVKGEVSNRSGKNYNAVAIRVVVFNKNIPLANFVIIVNGLQSNQTKSFEKAAEDLEYDQVFKNITRYEVLTESAY